MMQGERKKVNNEQNPCGGEKEWNLKYKQKECL